MKTIYILYDCRDRKILYKTFNKEAMYAQIGQMAINGEYNRDLHLIKIDLSEVK